MRRERIHIAHARKLDSVAESEKYMFYLRAIRLYYTIISFAGMNLNHLFLFRAVAEAGGFSRAAERIHVSQPAISMQVGELEEHLGLTLLQRLGALAAEAERAMAEVRGLRRGHLAIGASTTIGVYLLPNLLGEYRRLYPDIDLQFDIANTEDIERRLADGTLDAGLTEGLPPNSEELETLVFLRDQLVPIARADHPRLKPGSKPLTLRQLCAEPMIVREAGSGTREVIERALAKRGQKLQRTTMVLGSTEAIKRAVAAGLGVAIVSHLTIQTELASGQLAILPVHGFQLSRPLHRLYWRNRAGNPATLAFLALLDQRYPPEMASGRRLTRKS